MWNRREFLGAVGMAGAAGAAAALGSCMEGARPAAAREANAASLDRWAILKRHSPRIRSVDPLAVLSVGNGNFAFNVDCTGLQSLPAAYTTIPLATMSHWGWHSMPTPAEMGEYRLQEMEFYGRACAIPHGAVQPGGHVSAGQSPSAESGARWIGARWDGTEGGPSAGGRSAVGPGDGIDHLAVPA